MFSKEEKKLALMRLKKNGMAYKRTVVELVNAGLFLTSRAGLNLTN